MNKPFVHTHVHTQHSLLDGLSNIEDLIARAVELQQPAIAITDHGTMSGVYKFQSVARQAGLNPLIGCEVYVAPRSHLDKDREPFHLLLLAMDETGYGNLMKLVTIASLRGFYYKPRIDWDLLQQYSEGLITTTGCLAAQIPRLVAAGKIEEADAVFERYLDLFGDRFYLELQMHDDPKLVPMLERVNGYLLGKMHTHGVQPIATSDVHYVRREDCRLHDVLLCINTGSRLNDPARMKMEGTTYYLQSRTEMEQVWSEIPAALDNTVRLAERCDVRFNHSGYYLPPFAIPDGYTVDSYLESLCQKGLIWRYGERASSAEVQERLSFELTVIRQMGFSSYFLLVWDLTQYARTMGIWHNARGSAAGSIVSYALGVSLIDPLEHGLMFERFLNPGRISMPDIDLDFADHRRGEMIAYAVRKYGEDKVAAISTFATMGGKGAFRDAARAYGLPLNETDRIAKMIPDKTTIADARTGVAELRQALENDPLAAKVMDTAARLVGVKRQAGQHAAGYIIGDRPLDQIVPLVRLDKKADIVQQAIAFDMNEAEKLGLLKVDFLGLSTLTALETTCNLIWTRHGVRYTAETIPYRHTGDPENDAAVDAAVQLIASGETVGVFQVEGEGITAMLKQMQPKTYANIMAAVALYRPGPMEHFPTYNNRLHGAPVETLHPRLAELMADTYGIIVYQEQVMKVAADMFGYLPGAADQIRKAVSKKIRPELEKHRITFMTEGVTRGIDEETITAIFDEIQKFADYAFPKSHAASYGMVTMFTAYLKARYPSEFMAGLLSAHLGDMDKMALYLNDCRRMGIQVLPPCVNESGVDFTVDREGNIRMGMGAIKNVGLGFAQTIVDARTQRFASLSDFCQRVQLNKKGAEWLIKVGALDTFGYTRAALIASLDNLMVKKKTPTRQLSMFDDLPQISIKITPTSEYPERERLAFEHEGLGIYLSARPVDRYRTTLSQQDTVAVSRIPDHIGASVKVGGEIVAVRKITTKKGDPMARVTIEDWRDGQPIVVVVFPRDWSTTQLYFVEGAVVTLWGRVERSQRDNEIQLLFTTLETCY